MGSGWSDEAIVMVRPTEGFRRSLQRAEAAPWRTLFGHVLLLQTFIGLFVTFTTARALILWHVVFAGVFWGFVPFIQLGLTAAVLRVAKPPGDAPATRTLLAVHGAKNGPFYGLILLLSALFLFSPDLGQTFFFALGYGILPVTILLAFGWAIVLTYFFYKTLLSVSRGRAIGMTLLDALLKTALIVGYYVVIGNLLPAMGIIE